MLLTSKFNRLFLFVFASLGMVLMHVVSCLMGAVIPLFLPIWLVQVLVIGLFLGFGLQFICDSVACKLWVPRLMNKHDDVTHQVSDTTSSDNSDFQDAKEQVERIEAL
jgi:putative Ca2+/H+ antiporter (TMEM165/GDT1 family)